MREYWIWDIKLGRQKVKIKTYKDSGFNPCHRAIRYAKKHRKGDDFYLEGNNIVRYKKDVIGTYKVKSVPVFKDKTK